MLSTKTYPIHYWEAPSPEEISDTLDAFLEQLQGPTWIYIPGQDHSRCRVITTLLHGNEPSGLHAIHHWLRAGETPCTDLYCFIASIDAARQPPVFHYRMLPHHRDLNRCFRPPYKDQEGKVAADLLHRLCAVEPEAVLDIHNTSGSGPSFAVATNSDTRHVALCTLFTNHLIITDLKLGAIMEFEQGGFPITTIECGGCHDPQAHQLAIDGMQRFARKQNLFSPTDLSAPVTIYKHPLRVELMQDTTIAYGNQPSRTADLTMHNNIERFNFNEACAGSLLGWLGECGLSGLTARDALGREHINHYFEQVGDQLRTRHTLRLFMVTKNPAIAKSDCLFYLVPVNDELRH